jgi:hypothetical protein
MVLADDFTGADGGSFIEVHVRARRANADILAGLANSHLTVRLIGA